MKFKFLFAATVVAFLVASCGGVDKGLVDNIAKFEGEWTAMVTHVNGMADTMTTVAAETTKACEEACNKECTDKKMKASMDSLKMNCAGKEGMSMTIKNITDFKTKLKLKTEEFTAWKAKVMSGEVKGDEAVKKLKEFQDELIANQDPMNSFQGAFDMSKEECMAACTTSKDCCEKK